MNTPMIMTGPAQGGWVSLGWARRRGSELLCSLLCQLKLFGPASLIRKHTESMKMDLQTGLLIFGVFM
jgi:hypothetical protein